MLDFLNNPTIHILISTFCFSLMAIFVKKISHLPEMEIIFFRCLISAFFCLVYFRKTKISWKGSNKSLLILRGVFGTLALYLYFITLHNMPLATASVIQYTAPIFTAILAVFVFKNRMNWKSWLSFLVSFAGIIIIKGFDARVSVTMLCIGILSAMCSAIAYTLIRKTKDKEHPLVVVFYFQVIGMILGFIFSLFHFQIPSFIDFLYIGCVGLFTQMGQFYLTKSFQKGETIGVSSMNYSGIIFALFFGWLLFDEHYTTTTLLGLMLTIFGIFWNTLNLKGIK